MRQYTLNIILNYLRCHESMRIGVLSVLQQALGSKPPTEPRRVYANFCVRCDLTSSQRVLLVGVSDTLANVARVASSSSCGCRHSRDRVVVAVIVDAHRA